MPREEAVETPLEDSGISFHVMYKYHSQEGNEWIHEWGLAGVPTFREAWEKAARWRAGEPPSDNGPTDIYRTQIYERINASHVLLEEGDE